MTDYKAIKGKHVLSIASDLDNAEGEGQIWFNTTSADFKTIAKVAGAWATGGSINSARSEFQGAGTQTAFLVYGGGAPNTTNESYNGSTWTEVADLNAAHWYAGGWGTQTAAVCATGSPYPLGNVETWDGSSWTETTDVNTARWGVGASKAAPQTAALIAAGKTSGDVANVESWDGSSWTETGDVNTARRQVGAAGIQTAMLIYSGTHPNTNTEQWDGTSWTEVADVGNARYAPGSSGNVSLAHRYGGSPPTTTTNEQWDGATWTEVGDLLTGSVAAASGGTGVSALVAGGRAPGGSNHTVCNEWNYTSTLAAGAWASGGNLPSSRGLAATMGTQTATLMARGYSESGTPPSSGGYFNNSLEYDGSSWGGSADLSRSPGSGLAAAGTQTAGLLVGGGEYVFPGSNTATEEVETYDGSSWTEIADINTERYDGACGGTQTAAILFGGYDPALSPINIGNAETWNGSSWTEVADLNTARRRLMGSSIGTSTASLAVGGYTGYIASVETWDGSSWTEIADLNTARHSGGGCGTQTEAFAFGGWNGEAVPNSEEFDGSTWTEVADLSTNINGYGSGAGTQSLAIIAGGGPLPANPGTLGTEEWTKAQNIEVITD